MLLMKVFKHDALDKLTTGSGALSNLAGEAVLDDLLSNVRKETCHVIVDFDRMKHAWLEDDIQYVLDVIYDFYESKGLLNDDTDEEVEIVEEELLHYILKAVKKDEMDAEKLTEENVQLILDAEYEYSESLGVY